MKANNKLKIKKMQAKSTQFVRKRRSIRERKVNDINRLALNSPSLMDGNEMVYT